MLIALSAERSFEAPRTKFELDPNELERLVGREAQTKGMFINRALAQVDGRAEEFDIIAAAGLDEDYYVPFKDYPWIDFIRICIAVADVIYPERRPAGLRHIGRTFYAEFAESVAGRVTFGLLMRNADRVMSLGAKAWNMSGSPGKVVSESMGDQHYRYHYTDFPAQITESLAVGIIEGALAECGERPQLSFAEADPMNSIIDIRWGED